FPVRGCSVSYGHYHHDYPATDIFTQKGCAFVSPVDGRVDEVSYVDRWDPSVDAGSTRGGLSVSVVGVDGVRYYGSHLESTVLGRVLTCKPASSAQRSSGRLPLTSTHRRPESQLAVAVRSGARRLADG